MATRRCQQGCAPLADSDHGAAAGQGRAWEAATSLSAAVQGGVTMVQLREKTATTRAFLEEARALQALPAPAPPRRARRDPGRLHRRPIRVAG